MISRTFYIKNFLSLMISFIKSMYNSDLFLTSSVQFIVTPISPPSADFCFFLNYVSDCSASSAKSGCFDCFLGLFVSWKNGGDVRIIFLMTDRIINAFGFLLRHLKLLKFVKVLNFALNHLKFSLKL